ncbi:MAG TPA: hypothetical protein VJ201_08775 [Candidatus Babeliales bacterium]|nr:hypothetical protein [Candidatus Babeliales bacterium]
MKKTHIETLIHILQKITTSLPIPLSKQILLEYGRDPFLILISCLLSLRAKDKKTISICRTLFTLAKTPEALLQLPQQTLETIIFPIGLHKHKATTLHTISKTLIDTFQKTVPNTTQELLSIHGIGKKTTNLVLGLAFEIPALCVYIHVHRISNRLGIIKTTHIHNSEHALQIAIPQKYWIEWNQLLVPLGQNICVPTKPFCSKCPIFNHCARNEIKRSR